MLKFISLSIENPNDTDFEAAIRHEELLGRCFEKIMALLQGSDLFLAIEATRCLNFLASRKALCKDFGIRALPIIYNLFHVDHIDGGRMAYLCLGSFMEMGLANETLEHGILNKIYEESVDHSAADQLLELKMTEEAMFCLHKIHAHFMHTETNKFEHVEFLARLLRRSPINLVRKSSLSMLHELVHKCDCIGAFIAQQYGEELILLSHIDKELAGMSLYLFNKIIHSNKDTTSHALDISFHNKDGDTRKRKRNRERAHVNIIRRNDVPAPLVPCAQLYNELDLNNASFG